MPRRQWLFVCAFPALSTVLLASEAKTPAAPAGSCATDAASECRAPALLSWGDIDGDGLMDVFATHANAPDQLFHNQGDGSFFDVTTTAGFALDQYSDTALWADFNRDGKLDLYLAAARADRRLFENRGNGTFRDVTAALGLDKNDGVHEATWIDYDGDGFPDLVLHTSAGDCVIHNGGGTWFEPIQLGLPIATRSTTLPTSRSHGDDNAQTPRDGKDENAGAPRTRDAASDPLSLATIGAGTGSVTNAGPHTVAPAMHKVQAYACAESMLDTNNTQVCIKASNAPRIGFLCPMSTNLNVNSFGDVGIGTTSQNNKLEVIGTVKLSGFHLAPGASPNRVLTCDSSGIGTWQPLPPSSGVGGSGTVGTLARFTASGAIGNSVVVQSATGYVGIGTSTPDAKLDVAGNAHMTDTLTLEPSHDKALNIQTGGIYMGGSGFIHIRGEYGSTAVGIGALQFNTTGNRNTAIGFQALSTFSSASENTATGFYALTNNTTGHFNTASGVEALKSNTSGYRNTAIGNKALFSNTIRGGHTAIGHEALFGNTNGRFNTATGHSALAINTSGNQNTASGAFALFVNGSGNQNTACGYGALLNTSGGSRNIALGHYAGENLGAGDDNILIGNNFGAGGGPVFESKTIRIGTSGTHTQTYIAGINGATVNPTSGTGVFVDNSGRLGTVVSSRRFKKDIGDMGDATQRLLELRPVVFRYKPEQPPRSGVVPPEYGLIAEEVAEIFPDLVVYDEEGMPFTVKYHLLSTMLLNELKKMSAAHAGEMEELRNRLAAVEARTLPSTLPAVMPANSR